MPSNNFDAPVFDPNAGRLEAYNLRWTNYLTNLGKTLNKINVKKARKYFDQQFELDWNNGAASREIDFIKNKAQLEQNLIFSKFWDDMLAYEDSVSAQDEKDYTDAGYTYDLNKGWVKPESITPKNTLSTLDTRTREDIMSILLEMVDAGYGHMLGKYGPKGDGVDGYWGPATLKAWELYTRNGMKPFNPSSELPPQLPPQLPPTNIYYKDNAGNRYSYNDNTLKLLSNEDLKDWTDGGYIKDMDAFKNSIDFQRRNISFGGMNWANPYYLDNVFRSTDNAPDWHGSGIGRDARVRVKGKEGVFPLRVWNNRSFAIDLANKKAYELSEDMFGEVDGRGDDAPINTYDLYSFFNNYTPEELKYLKSLKLGGILNLRFKIGGIIKLILKNSKVYPYNI